MTGVQQSPDSIFWEALKRESPVERASYLDKACGGDSPLRNEIEELLATYPRAEAFLERPPPDAVALGVRANPPRLERPGETIGPYKLLQQIGEGGFGIVFMAQQLEPVNRRVALKVLKPGMDTRQVIARFDQERLALALMDHPSIAKVLDAGTTAGGRPYFVMELVLGVPITKYCDEKNLTIHERLELVVLV